ncbi:alpha/beta hydrolase [Chryseobacterium luquanense]|uniref:Dienelactone hydrolase family protein n=1 Tax=Chryseobacterium luquanense TaxID=2983766 RepID=A0ABT3Y7Q2_9FLAO|nr:dienelactone hydrolase family protein [Chryseobacterium luquanense]MCX8534143.1 dienelactone hydrolase family protein [Chryseobacterium luquanense]
MKKIKSIALLLMMYSGLSAQQNVILPINGKINKDIGKEEKTSTMDPKSDSCTVYNVTVPSLAIYKPEGVASNGTAVLVVPGGAFHILAYDDEGVKIAKSLASKGYTAAVLKYRLVKLDNKDPFGKLMENAKNFDVLESIMAPVVPLAIADGKEAMKYLKSNATALGFNKDRIGVVGFSAGGTIAAAIALDKDVRPLFSAPIYPYLAPVMKTPIPADPSPIFIAVTQDDDFGFDINSAKFYENWKVGKGLAELHIYTKGHHGFASKTQGLPVDHWEDRMIDWLTSMGF